MQQPLSFSTHTVSRGEQRTQSYLSEYKNTRTWIVFPTTNIINSKTVEKICRNLWRIGEISGKIGGKIGGKFMKKCSHSNPSHWPHCNIEIFLLFWINQIFENILSNYSNEESFAHLWTAFKHFGCNIKLLLSPISCSFIFRFSN